MKNKLWLFGVLGALFAVLGISSIYINFIAETSSALEYILIGQMFLGIISALITLFLGMYAFPEKKNYELLLIGFLEILFVLGIIIVNYVYGYNAIVNRANYIDYMEYVSMEFNIFIYLVFVCVIGLLALNLFIKEKLSLPVSTKIIEEDK